MPDIFHFISEYFWLALLGFGAFNYWKARHDIENIGRVESAAEGANYLRRFAIGANLPWVVMGLGCVSGYTPTVWHYFRPQDGNPFVIAWLTVILCTASVYAWWVLFAGGAEKVQEFNLLSSIGQRTFKQKSIRSIKLLAILGVFMVPIWVLLVVAQNVPLPK
jgi:hypothetical protein